MNKVVAIVLISPMFWAQDRQTVWNGAYTADQAAQGEVVFRACTRCHGSGLEGGAGGSNPPLRGERFMDHWREDNLESLYLFIKNTMPPQANSPLTETDVLNVTSYLLQSNGFPAGSTALTVNALPFVRIEGREGPRPLPDYALVQVVGCLKKGDGSTWTLTNSTEPVRARRATRPTPEELKTVQAKALGSFTLRLQNLAMAGLLDPSNMEGHKMFAKGALIRNPEGDRISITSLDSLGPACQ